MFKQLGFLTVAIALSSCYQAPKSSVDQSGNTLDEHFADLNEEIPGFGGMFIDESGQVNVYLTADAPKISPQSISAAVTDTFGSEISATASSTRRIVAKYTFTQLNNWNKKALALFDDPGVLKIDTDERANRLSIGVDKPEQIELIKQRLNQLGIPQEAVNIEVTEPFAQFSSLRDHVEPLVGGVQINPPGYLCSYGFNANRLDVPGFFTNSHCTPKEGFVDNANYWQPVKSSTNLIGIEIVDPPYSANICPPSLPNKICRLSDAAFIQLNSGIKYEMGFLANTDPNSLTIVGNYRIVSKAQSVLVGQNLTKIGRSTGKTSGLVDSTCVNVSVYNTNRVLVCQNIVKGILNSGTISSSGDSGSPVFRYISDKDVELHGILWGGNSTNNSFVYSPIVNIEREFGDIKTCYSSLC